MADPREVPVEQRRKLDHLSPLMRRKAQAKKQEVVNACPYGCGVRDLDENGYCKHLVGFSNDGRTYEPMLLVAGRRVVRVAMEEDPEGEADPVYGRPLRPKPLPLVKPDDRLMKITTSSRVYRDVDGKGAALARRQEEEERERKRRERRSLLEEIKNDPELRLEWQEALTTPDEGVLAVEAKSVGVKEGEDYDG
ncbi:MAG: hypothetical protein V4510_11495 [bacterium]